MTTNPSAGDTVIPTKTSINITKSGEEIPRNIEGLFARAESTPAARKRPLDSSSPKAEIPTKSPRRGEPLEEEPGEEKHKVEESPSRIAALEQPRNSATMCVVNNLKRTESRPDVLRDKTQIQNARKRQTATKIQIPLSPVVERQEKRPAASSPVLRTLKRPSEDASDGFKSTRKSRADVDTGKEVTQSSDQTTVLQKPQTHQHFPKRDEAVKLRKTIQWLEEGARRMREDLAATRAELHEERRAARLAKRELDSAVKDARVGEAAKQSHIISELKSRLAQSPTRPTADSTPASSKAEFLRGENHRRELSALRKRLAEAEATVQKLKANACSPHGSGKRRKVENPDGRRLEVEVQALRAANKKLEERLQLVTEAERKRGAELRIQHENHEAQLASLQKTLRSDTIKMMDEIRSKTREIEKLEKLVLESSQMHRKLQTKEDDLMRKLRETERSHQIRLAPRIEEKISSSTDHVENMCNGDCDAAAEVDRLRELSVEQQEIIEVLRQAVKEKERKLDQISNKKRKEEFYKQWLELEPVVEVEDEDEHEHEEGDSALSSAPSSLSPQPGGCGQWQHTGVTREAYETVLLEVEELQTRLVEEQRELAHAKSQVRDLEKALLQETRGSQNSRRALSDKLREIEEREATLVAEISELREQNELLEFRVLELEETPCLRDTPDPADSGIVSPEPIHLYKDQLNKQRDRAVATVIPYNTYNSPVSPIPQKPPLSLQESGIFDEEDEAEVELASCGTQTETPAGDLLQEVQRLHELRARIQERAVKVPVPVVDNKLYSVPDVTEVTEAGQGSLYQERIRELEQRLEAYEEAENKRLQDKILSKQREEDLLDENYRLTERIYWFENILRNLKNSENDQKGEEDSSGSAGRSENYSKIEDKPEVNGNDDFSAEELSFEMLLSHPKTSEDQKPEESDDTSSSEVTLHQNEEISYEKSSWEKNGVEDPSQILSSPDSSSSEKLAESSKLKSDVAGCTQCGKMGEEIIERLEELVEVEVLTRQRIVDLERRESTYMKTLQKADETWTQTELCYSTQLEELRVKLELELSTNKKLAHQVMKLEDQLKDLQRCGVCQESLVDHHADFSSYQNLGVDEVDPCRIRRSIECGKCQASKKSRTITPMEVDQPPDAVDGLGVQRNTSSSLTLHKDIDPHGENMNLEKDPDQKVQGVVHRTDCLMFGSTPKTLSARNSVSVVNLTSEQNATRTPEVSKVFVPEMVAELATEAKEEEVRPKRPEKGGKMVNDNIPVFVKAEEVAEAVEESPVPALGKDEVGVDVVEGEGAEAEPVVTINETEPEKKETPADEVKDNLLSLEIKPTMGFSVVFSRNGGFLPTEDDLALFNPAVLPADVDEPPFSNR